MGEAARSGSSLVRIGRYEVLGRLAVGGMGEILLARTTGVGGFEKIVVLKRILPQFVHDEDFRKMFLEEARLAGKLEHPNVVRIYDVDEHSSNFYLAMEYIHGEDLRKILKTAVEKQAPVPVEFAVTLGIEVCEGLHYAHTLAGYDGTPLNIVHRDISPANVLVTYDGFVKVVDFGIARAQRTSTLTKTGQRKGKIAYMSPEQVRGEPVDARSDVFAIGVLLWEMTTLRRLFRADDEVAIMNKILNEPISRPSEWVRGYPLGLEQVLMRALSKDPDHRYRTARELQEALESFARSRRISTTQSTLRSFLLDLFGDAREVPWRDETQLTPLAEQEEFTAVQPEPARTRDDSASGLLESREAPADALEDLDAVPPAPSRPGLPWAVGVGVLGVAILGLGLWGGMVLARTGSSVDEAEDSTLPAAAAPIAQPLPQPVEEAEPAPPEPAPEPVEASAAEVDPEFAAVGGTDTGGVEPDPEPEPVKRKKKKRRGKKKSAPEPVTEPIPEPKPKKEIDPDAFLPG